MSGSRTVTRPSPRLAHLDRLKVLLTAGVIVAHAAMSYGASGTWKYEEDSLSPATGLVLSALVGGGVMFRARAVLPRRRDADHGGIGPPRAA